MDEPNFIHKFSNPWVPTISFLSIQLVVTPLPHVHFGGFQVYKKLSKGKQRGLHLNPNFSPQGTEEVPTIFFSTNQSIGFYPFPPTLEGLVVSPK
jgi:hypothetical protein